ncbi:hypothetical protein LAJ19_19760 (plasmid) [Deinococcus taeanensis]|uniref:hypothetical protein n=1 Tax=Deinococcus taeanensis TaxID=2737050 RepID=UPI001CDC3E9C|nr:hypothetical protein [Deinococcus taeanensis]UBV45375.1 hypothetical protein LAJ19_19760 [Deinococcus taeanensis]
MTRPGDPEHTVTLLRQRGRGTMAWTLQVAEHVQALPEPLRGVHRRILQRHATILRLPVSSWLTGVAAGMLAHWLGGLTLGFPLLWALDGAVRPADDWLVLWTVAVMGVVVWAHGWWVRARLPGDLRRLGLGNSDVHGTDVA